jgi:antitoxin CptB
MLENKARIKWACRRGMLELDVIIMPFFEACFDVLSSEEKNDFVVLLEADDPDLFAWLMGHAQCQNPALSRMVDKIVSYNLAKLR